MIHRLYVCNLKIAAAVILLFLLCTSSAFAEPGSCPGSIVPDSNPNNLQSIIDPNSFSAGTSSFVITTDDPVAVTTSSIESTEVTEDTGATEVVPLADSIVVSAYSLFGKPYVYGATGSNAFDCSGFVQYVYNANGISLPRIACDQANVGTTVNKSELAPGDLVFFGYYGSKSIHHVGIYVGDNQFIHASSGKGSVTVSDLSNTYYANNYRWAKRIVN